MKKMIKRIMTLSLALLLCFSFAGCGAKYDSITAQEAKALMDSETGYVILDVRHSYEFAAEHIANAINIDNDEIEDKAESILTDKDQLILVYCKSGNRSKKASEKLAKMGYTNVKEFGGIQQWPYDNKVSG